MIAPARLAATIAASLALVAAACSAETPAAGQAPPTSEPGRSPAPASAPPTGEAPQAMAEILDFEAPLLGGGTFRGADLAGKDVAFWFWAPW
jgi:hypothetical protein